VLVVINQRFYCNAYYMHQFDLSISVSTVSNCPSIAMVIEIRTAALQVLPLIGKARKKDFFYQQISNGVSRCTILVIEWVCPHNLLQI